MPSDPTAEIIAATPCSNCAALREQVRKLEIRNLGLRRRTHMLQEHNQHFERCESAWCHPDASNDPAMDVGSPEIWPALPVWKDIDA